MNKEIKFEVDIIANLNKDLYEAEALITHKSPPKDYPKEKTEYADPKNYKYPINNESRVRAAWSYINKPHNQKGYTPAEVAAIKSRIKKAGKKYGIDFESDKK